MQHNRGREFEDPLTEEELMLDTKEAIIAKWSDREKNIFYLFAKSLLTGTKLRKKMSVLRQKIANKPRGDIVEYYYIVKDEPIEKT